MERKLNFELVPDGCWFVNLRSHYSKSDWDKLRLYAKAKANGKCMICGRKTDRLEGHEKWVYDEENALQRLEGIVSICKDCHNVIHIGRTSLYGDIERAEKHYMKVNNVTYAEYRQDLGKANEIHRRRNQISEWVTDISYAEDLLKKIKTEK